MYGQADSTAATPPASVITGANQAPAKTSGEFEALGKEADAAREQDHTDEAIGYYQKALGMRPDWPEGWWYLGTLYAASDRHGEAASAFKKVVEAKPQFGPGWASLGLAEYEATDFHGSFEALLRAQELGFTDAPQLEKPATYHLALLFNLNGRFEELGNCLQLDLARRMNRRR
jgi:tetratricopeptide (TPR) repeat protein